MEMMAHFLTKECVIIFVLHLITIEILRMLVAANLHVLLVLINIMLIQQQ